MRRLVLALAAVSSGCASEVLLERPALTAGPVDCAALCTSLSAQLLDAGVAHDCTTPRLAQAADCDGCLEAFQVEFDVHLPTCR